METNNNMCRILHVVFTYVWITVYLNFPTPAYHNLRHCLSIARLLRTCKVGKYQLWYYFTSLRTPFLNPHEPCNLHSRLLILTMLACPSVLPPPTDRQSKNQTGRFLSHSGRPWRLPHATRCGARPSPVGWGGRGSTLSSAACSGIQLCARRASPREAPGVIGRRLPSLPLSSIAAFLYFL